MLTSQMIRGDKGGGPVNFLSTGGGSNGGAAGGSTADLSHLIKEHQEKMRQEYEGKLADLERERESIEEEKAQVRSGDKLSSLPCEGWRPYTSCTCFHLLIISNAQFVLSLLSGGPFQAAVAKAKRYYDRPDAETERKR